MAISATAANDANLVSSVVAIIILLLRAWVSRNASHVTPLSKQICLLSLLICAARIPVAYYALQRTSRLHQVETEDSTNIAVRSLLAKDVAAFTLTARCLSTTFFWLQIILLQRFYSRVVNHIQWTRTAINVTWVMIIITYIACILVTLLECRPLSLYWQLDTQPQCARAYTQLFLQGGSNILLDIMLLVIAFPIAQRQRLTRMQTLQVAVLMGLGTFCIIVTGLKLAYVVGADSNQAARTFWASVQVAVSAFVANAPTIYGCVRLENAKSPRQQQVRDADWRASRLSRVVRDEEMELRCDKAGCLEVESVVSSSATEGTLKKAQRERSWLEQ